MSTVQPTDGSDAASKKPIRSLHAEREARILTFWKEKGIFEKSVQKEAPHGDYTFYDGPPFATGLPHYGHIVPNTVKDIIPRFKTMQGYRVRRRWGWDCHGLPVENLIEKELGLGTKKDILEYGIGKFNAKARESVMRYADAWRTIIPRLGRWVDMDEDYRTMDASYTETVWWIFSQLHDKGLIYEGFKSMNLCPRCETTLSNFEVAQGYKDVTDLSVIAKFGVRSSEYGGRNTEKGEGSKKQGEGRTENGEGRDKGATFILAWTTTPWTLPGNVALAVNPKIEYVKVKSGEEFFILAKERLSALKDAQYTLVETIPGKDLVGTSYEPLFDYYAKDSTLKNRDNGWKVYGADFVTTEDGTGVVHIAPAFGADDYELLKKHDLPFVQHVRTDGHFKPEVTDFAGMAVKPKDTEAEKDAHQKADIEIIKWLAHHGSLFAKEKLIHSYPHCWRCETPLLNYASSSWFVKVTGIKDALVKENKKIEWVPSEIGEGRFGNWLEGARDWAISRSRFWGAPIPVWKDEQGSAHIIGSVADLKKYSKPKNTYSVMRHGEAENNTKGILDSHLDSKFHLTQKGIGQVEKAAADLKRSPVDLIIASPLLRTRQTAEIVHKSLNLPADALIVDERIHEYNAGVFNGRTVAELMEACAGRDRFTWTPENGENYFDIKKRMGDFLYDIEQKYSSKHILIITHETPALLLYAAANALLPKDTDSLRPKGEFILNAEVKQLDFAPLPHNDEYELDLHRPFIDDLELKTTSGSRLTRVPDVFDCWFESGAMPYGEAHYPFENRGRTEYGERRTENGERRAQDAIFEPKSGLFRKSKGYPADFVAEGLDQTRGWFYSMIVLGVALFGTSPYKKVIVNGLVLAEDGQKMSKSKMNYPDPMLIVDKYGADALRYYLVSSGVVRGQDFCFSEKGVDDVTKKLINRLLNVVSFYEMYADPSTVASSTTNPKSSHVLDQWIIGRLNETIALVTQGLEAGELDRASRPFNDFIDDLSTWYLRRSRDRFKAEHGADKQAALDTTRYVLMTFAKTMAPFMPFLAEDIYGRMKGSTESVHLEVWPQAEKVEAKLLSEMKLVRDIASKGLEARMKASINVRQPLKTLKVKTGQSAITSAALLELITDEVNVKEVTFGNEIETDVALDTTITPDLKEEGMVRELIRAIQDLRKQKGLSVSDRVVLIADTDSLGKSFIEKNKVAISSTTSLTDIVFETQASEEIKAGELTFKFGFK